MPTNLLFHTLEQPAHFNKVYSLYYGVTLEKLLSDKVAILAREGREHKRSINY